MTTHPHRADMERVSELPGLIEQAERILLGLKDSKAKVERRRKSVEARVRLSEEVKSEQNAENRAAAHVLECENNPEWVKLTDRLEELNRTIRSHEAQRDAMRRERDGLNTALMLRVAERMEKILANKDFVAAVGAGMLA